MFDRVGVVRECTRRGLVMLTEGEYLVLPKAGFALAGPAILRPQEHRGACERGDEAPGNDCRLTGLHKALGPAGHSDGVFGVRIGEMGGTRSTRWEEWTGVVGRQEGI